MKKLLLVLLLSVTSLAQAHGYYGGGHYYGHGQGWVGPAIIGGLIGYQLSQPRTTVIVQQPVYVQQPTVVQQTPYGYHYENIMDANCGCYRVVLVPN